MIIGIRFRHDDAGAFIQGMERAVDIVIYDKRYDQNGQDDKRYQNDIILFSHSIPSGFYMALLVLLVLLVSVVFRYYYNAIIIYPKDKAKIFLDRKILKIKLE